MKRITDFEVIDHGVYHSQSFPGCGVAFTQYDDVVTGIGFSSTREAFEDCLEQLASAEFEIPAELENEVNSLSDTDDVRQSYLDCGEEVPDAADDCELYCYVSVRIKSERKESA